MKIFKKRGISSVIASVLLILLTIVLTGIIAVLVKNFTEKSIEESSKCHLLIDYIKFEDSLGLTCVNVTAGNITSYSIAVKTISENLPSPLIGFDIVLNDDKESTVKKVRMGGSSSNMLDGIWMVYDPSSLLLNIPKQGEVITYAYNASRRYNKIEVYPVVEGDNICPMTDSISLKEC